MNEKLLTSQERQEFAELEQMFGTPGWRRMKATIQQEIDTSPAHYFANAQSWEELLAARARIRVLLELVSYEALQENRKENLLQGREFEQEDREDSDSVTNL